MTNNSLKYYIYLIIILIILIILLPIFKKVLNVTKVESFDNQIKKYNIIQYNDGKDLNQDQLKLINIIKKLNPNANYILLNRFKIEKFIKDNYPNYIPILQGMKFEQSKIDFSIYLLIYHYGGIYLDFNVEIFESFKDINFDKVIFPLQYSNINNLVLKPQGYQILLGNYFFYSPSKHSFMKRIIDNIATSKITIYDNFNFLRYIFYTTGPVLITQTYIDYRNKNEILVLSLNPFQESYFGKYGKYLKILNLYNWSRNLYPSSNLKMLSYPTYEYYPILQKNIC